MDTQKTDVRLSARISKELHDALRAESFQTRKSINQIVAEALTCRYSEKK